MYIGPFGMKKAVKTATAKARKSKTRTTKRLDVDVPGANGDPKVNSEVPSRRTQKRQSSGREIDSQSDKIQESVSVAIKSKVGHPKSKEKLINGNAKHAATRSRVSPGAGANLSSCEEGNDFVTTEVSGNISDYPSDFDYDDEDNDAEASDREDNQMNSPSARRAVDTEEHHAKRSRSPHDRRLDSSGSVKESDRDFDHVERIEELENANSELKEAQQSLSIIQRYMLKKGIINENMSKDEVMEFLEKDADSDSGDKRAETPPRKSAKKKRSRDKSQGGKDAFNLQSPSETTIYTKAVKCRDPENETRHKLLSKRTNNDNEEVQFNRKNSPVRAEVV